ncbi:hypothetical protein GCM10010140_64690 [Streptosporangium pseudovulgare]|uniref:Uncharacterized protein n=1 Tax=Streptosporangium pseudovulgare TaxID=35765 RepID=A0ABQ2RGI7_9ACTN|nr:hypothetical protein GCM10010140_64690 [Streptosporangium pseudovulgare]
MIAASVPDRHPGDPAPAARHVPDGRRGSGDPGGGRAGMDGPGMNGPGMDGPGAGKGPFDVSVTGSDDCDE